MINHRKLTSRTKFEPAKSSPTYLYVQLFIGWDSQYPVGRHFQRWINENESSTRRRWETRRSISFVRFSRYGKTWPRVFSILASRKSKGTCTRTKESWNCQTDRLTSDGPIYRINVTGDSETPPLIAGCRDLLAQGRGFSLPPATAAQILWAKPVAWLERKRKKKKN